MSSQGEDGDLLDLGRFSEAIWRAFERHAAGSVIHVDIDRLDVVDGEARRAAMRSAEALLMRWASREHWALGKVRSDEFALFAPEVPLDQTLRLAEQLRDQLDAAMADAARTEPRVTASIGIASAPRDGIRWKRHRRQFEAAQRERR